MLDPLEITPSWFSGQLAKASKSVAEFTRSMIIQDIPESYVYVIQPNQSYDKNAGSNVDLYPDDSQTDVLDHDGVVSWCVRDGSVPEWINISVESVNESKTLFLLLCCGRFNGNMKELYYYKNGTHPFGLKSPTVPPKWNNIGKFNLYFHDRIRI